MKMEKDVQIKSHGDDLDQSLSELRKISNLLRTYGFYALVFTILNFAAQVLSFYVRFMVLTVYIAWFLIIYLPLILTLIAVLVVVRYESLRKRGDALFEEISDELHWNVRQSERDNKPHAVERPMLNARVILRSFARATDLPLVPGKYGPGIYATINFVLLLLGFFLFRVGRF